MTSGSEVEQFLNHAKAKEGKSAFEEDASANLSVQDSFNEVVILPLEQQADGSDNLLTFWQTTGSIFCLYIGAGILQLPLVFKLGGWMAIGIVGVVTAIFVVSALAAFDAIATTEKWEPELKGSEVRDFVYVGYKAFGQVGKKAVSSAIAVEFGMYGAYFLIIMTKNIEPVLPFPVGSALITVVLGFVGCALTFLHPSTLTKLNSFFGIGTLLTVCVLLVFGGGNLARARGPRRAARHHEWHRPSSGLRHHVQHVRRAPSSPQDLPGLWPKARLQ